MMEKAMYVKGLCEGLELDKTTKEGKILNAILGLVTEMAEEIDDMQTQLDELADYCDELDSDLGDVEEVLLDLDDDCFDSDDDDDDEDDDDDDDEDIDVDYECDGNCAGCDFDCGLGEDDDDFFGDEEDEDEYFEVICPACGDVINFDSSIDPENLRCPNCGEKFECIVEEDDLKALDGVETEE
jgi:hypothetical protein